MNDVLDLAEAQRFLTILDEEAEEFCFRVFDDDAARNDSRGARKFDGSLDAVGASLTAAGLERRGVFVVVNQGGQEADSICRIRAVFADTDGADLGPLLACDLEPHLIVESSPGKWHVYWLVDDLPLDRFRSVQHAIASEFGTDRSICDLPRVMRLPGSLHQKGKPFRVRVIHESGAPPYTAQRVLERFTAAEQAATVSAVPALADVVTVGRHAAILKETTFLADDIRRGHMTRAEALAIMDARRAAGRYTRDVPDDEIERALDGALGKSVAMPDKAPAAAVDFQWGDAMTDRKNLRPSEWAIRRVLPTECTALLYGGWGTCKTFTAIDMAGCIANGLDWHGKATRQGTVFYLAGEGEGGFARRLAAWETANNASTANIAFREMPEVRDPAQLDLLATRIDSLAAERGEPRLIVLDTLFTALNGGDENSGRDMGQVFAAMKRLRQRFRCAVMAVHHTGKQGEDARGHSSMPAGVDVQLYLKAKDAALELSNPKQKDGKKHACIFLTTESIQIPGLVDDDGEPETSLVIRAPAADMVASMQADRDKTDGVRDLKAHARDLKSKGMTLEQIGEAVGKDKSTVSRWLKD
ncbi:AAA family ATPase [Lysobacter sp. HA35]